jgi:hypothetical protein
MGLNVRAVLAFVAITAVISSCSTRSLKSEPTTLAPTAVIGGLTTLATITTAASTAAATSTTAPTVTATVAPAKATTTTAPTTVATTFAVGNASVVKVGEQWVVQLGPIPTVPLPSSTAPNPNVMHVVRPDDVPILEAYVRYITAINTAVVHPDTDLAILFEKVVTKTKFASVTASVGRHRAAGEILNVEHGVTVRPYVLGDPRSDSEATVYDCQLDGSYFVGADGMPLPGEQTGIRQYGNSARVVKVDGVWVVDETAQSGSACLPE